MLCKEYYDKLGFKKLTEVQRKILNKNKNILILSSCGSGKTEASYFNLLNDGKIIFVQPMKTLANSIEKRLNEYNSRLGLSNVSIQHSANQEDMFLQNKYSVTTIDQVLSGYLALGRQAFMRGKNILYSNLIFDEVQLFDADSMLLTTINMLDEINKLGNRFIIMTATMPQYLIDFLKERYDMDIIITTEERKDRVVKINYIEELDYDKINRYKGKQIIVCNTVNRLIEVYQNINKERVVVLHSKFTSEDREIKEKEVVKYFGKDSKDNDKILLTTQIVEAGMDISCDILYSELCSIDSLVQRDGRCCRWGGNGNVIVFNNNDVVYDIDVVNNTKNKLKNNNNLIFDWETQKKWINDILNPYYKSKITTKTLKKNKLNFKFCKRDLLIRSVQNVNVIVSNNFTREDFNRQSISISLSMLKKLSKNNELYIVKKNKVEKVNYNSVDIGDTVLIEGNDCIYDELGFRINEGANCSLFKMNHKTNKKNYQDYIEESWLDHAESVKDLFSYKLRMDKFNTYIIDNIKKIAFYGGLHDIGKLDKEWQKKCNSPTIPLAHFPFICGSKGEHRKHDLISAYCLKNIIDDKIIFNMILQHHRRFVIDDGVIKSTGEWSLCDSAKEILNEYGLNKEITYDSSDILIKDNDIITPKHKDWTTLLYLVGLFMEVEIQVINENIVNNVSWKVA